MLKSWSIQNFKPILNSGELKLAPVTVLAGRNSSGKSSLIQSILMIAQTLSSRVLDRPLVSHGSFAHLGTFEDVLNKYSGRSSLIIEFQLEVEEEVMPIPNRNRFLVGFPAIERLGTNIKSVSVRSEFFGEKVNRISNSAIEASKVNIEKVFMKVTSSTYRSSYEESSQGKLSRRDEPFEFKFNIRRMADRELEEFLRDVAPEFLRLVPYSSQETNYLGIFLSGDQSTTSDVPDPSLVAFSHFLPSRLTTKFKVEERRRRQLETTVALIFGSVEGVRLREIASSVNPTVPISDELKKELLEICKNENVSNAFAGKSLGDFANWFRLLKMGRGRKKSLLGVKFQSAIITYMLKNDAQSVGLDSKESEALETMVDNVYVRSVEVAVKHISTFFTTKIRYLGPLRADPEIVQGFPPGSEVDDVGSKGQYAATVYDANQKAKIRWYDPINQKIEQSELKTALDTWARYLDVAHQIQIEVAGQSGVSWQIVHRDGHEPLPLSAVGVGISQILPILVMGLLAPTNTLLLVEQPELHLHPSVQARLGDFFMGLAKCDKQCLIETHSENLVNQLRYHIVQANGQDESDCLIYFVDQDELGAAKFEPVEISPQGNILNWPEGFFDETILQEGRIHTESLRKRAKKAHNG